MFAVLSLTCSSSQTGSYESDQKVKVIQCNGRDSLVSTNTLIFAEKLVTTVTLYVPGTRSAFQVFVTGFVS